MLSSYMNASSVTSLTTYIICLSGVFGSKSSRANISQKPDSFVFAQVVEKLTMAGNAKTSMIITIAIVIRVLSINFENFIYLILEEMVFKVLIA